MRVRSRGFLVLLLSCVGGCSLFGYEPRREIDEVREGDAGSDAGLDADLPVVDAGSEAAAADLAEDAAPGDDESDAAWDAGLDASEDAASDAAAELWPDGAVLPDGTCGGSWSQGMCWYLALEGDSCHAKCSTHGSFDPRSLNFVGTSGQGGSSVHCKTVLSAIGAPTDAQRVNRQDGLGLGCHLWSDGKPYWADDPAAPFSASASAARVRIACACTR